MQSATTRTYSKKTSNCTSSDCSQCIKTHCNIFCVTVHSATKLPKLSTETPCTNFDYPLYIKSFKISKSLEMDIVIRLRGFQLIMSFLGRIGSVMKSLGLKDGIESIYTLVTSRGHFLLDSAIFTLILSNAIEDFITASFQIDDQNRINETNKTEIEAENRMNETENRQRKVNEQMKRRIPGKRKISQLSNKE